jgi:hypothetical protein
MEEKLKAAGDGHNDMRHNLSLDGRWTIMKVESNDTKTLPKNLIFVLSRCRIVGTRISEVDSLDHQYAQMLKMEKLQRWHRSRKKQNS